MNKKELEDAAFRFMKPAAKRFRAKAQIDDSSEYGAGYTWGAVDGYKAGYRAAMRKRASKRRGSGHAD